MQHKRFNTDNSSNSAQVKEKPELWDYLLVVGSTINRLGCMQCLLSLLFYVCSSNISYSTLHTLHTSLIFFHRGNKKYCNKCKQNDDDGRRRQYYGPGQDPGMAWLVCFQGESTLKMYHHQQQHLLCIFFVLLSVLKLVICMYPLEHHVYLQ